MFVWELLPCSPICFKCCHDMFCLLYICWFEGTLTLNPKINPVFRCHLLPSTAKLKLWADITFFITSLFLSFPNVWQSKAVLCPMSGRPIKMNELIKVRFTPLDPSLDRVALLTRQVSLHQHYTLLSLWQSFVCLSEQSITWLFHLLSHMNIKYRLHRVYQCSVQGLALQVAFVYFCLSYTSTHTKWNVWLDLLTLNYCFPGDDVIQKPPKDKDKCWQSKFICVIFFCELWRDALLVLSPVSRTGMYVQ